MIIAVAFLFVAVPVALLLVNLMNLQQARRAVRVRARDRDPRG